MTAPIRNILTVDVEDWIQSVYDPSAPLTDHFIRNTHCVLEHFHELGAHATFFVLGLAAEKCPSLVREIRDAGHDVQSHGYGHRLAHSQSPTEFRSDLERGKKLLEDVLGQTVVGYRAPAYSIGLRNLWCMDAVAECGFEYDASLCPVVMPRYGIAGIPRVPHRLITLGGRRLVELPVTTLRVFGRLIPAGGGGYARLWPMSVLRAAIRQMNRLGAASMFYMHPYEYNPDEIAALPIRVPWRMRLHQNLGRRHFRDRVDQLLRAEPFGSVAEWRALSQPMPEFALSTLGQANTIERKNASSLMPA